MAKHNVPYVLVLNCGSSSLKFAVLNAQTGQKKISGLAEKLNSQGPEIHFQQDGQKISQKLNGQGHKIALRVIFQHLTDIGVDASRLIGVGHRVVHGGEEFVASTLIDQTVLDSIQRCAHLAPLHNPANIMGIQTVSELLTDLPQVAVFDTAFHQTLEKHVYLYPVPYAWYEQKKVRRYGFHGSSHRYVVHTAYARQWLDKEAKIISAHLGNGCSACAIYQGKSIDTTMGLTPLEGLMMGTRTGNIDPAIPAFICQAYGMTIDEVMDALNKKSGLLGISMQTNDMRTIEANMAAGDKQSELAFKMFCFRLAKQIMSLTVALNGLDAIIFTGGIGENSSKVRAEVLTQLSYMNFVINSPANENHGKAHEGLITTGSPKALVIPTDEEWMIAQDTYQLIQHRGGV